ncbi:MAG: hypothetical protein ACJ8GJ_00650, partial [Vitreoscilla sp.]
RQSDALRLRGAVGSEGPTWVRELALANPGWMETPHGEADLLLAANMPVADFAALASDVATHPARRIVWWSAAQTDAAATDAALHAWYRAGWEPQLLETMGYRALSAFPELRASAIVLHPAEPERAARALAVRGVLSQPALVRAAAAPVPKRVLHPMQDMALAA